MGTNDKLAVLIFVFSLALLMQTPISNPGDFCPFACVAALRPLKPETCTGMCSMKMNGDNLGVRKVGHQTRFAHIMPGPSCPFMSRPCRLRLRIGSALHAFQCPSRNAVGGGSVDHLA